MSKPWISEDGGRQLEAFLGSRGMRTSEIRSTEELIQTAAGVFEIQMETTCRKMADVIGAMPKKARSKLARRNIGPSPHTPQKKVAQRGFLASLAREIGVNPAYLRQAIVAACDRIEARENANRASIQSRASASQAHWSRRTAKSITEALERTARPIPTYDTSEFTEHDIPEGARNRPQFSE